METVGIEPGWAGALLVLAALVIGFSKTSIGGLAVVSVVIFASVLPARQSTAAILMVLIVGDLVAVSHYRRDADWHLIRGLLPTVLPGLALGAAFLAVVDDTWLRRSIGILLLVMVVVQLVVNARGAERVREVGRPAALATGLAAGFTTMTANAAGAVMTLYLVAKGVQKRTFVGSSAWLFLGINLTKTPFSAGLGLLHVEDLLRAAVLAPVVVLGGWLGTRTVSRISQRGFERAVLLASALGAVALVVR